MLNVMRSPVLRYGFAVASVVVATAARLALNPALGETNVPYITYFLAVIVTAWACGFWPAMLSVALGAAAAAYFFVAPTFSLFVSESEHILSLIIFLFVGSVIAVLSEAMRRARARVEETARALSESREQLATTLKSIGDAVITTDAEGCVTFMNPVAQALTGWQAAQAKGQQLGEVFRIVNERTRATVESPVAKVVREDKVVGLANHTLLLARDGREIPIDDSGAPIRNEDGSIRGVILVFHETTERRLAEEALRKSEERLQLALEAARMGIWDWNAQTNELSWSESLAPIHGVASGAHPENFEAFVALIHPDDRQRVTDAVGSALAEGAAYDIEFRVPWEDGSFHWVGGVGRAFYDDGGQPVRMTGVGFDITDRKRAEEASRASEDRYRAFVGNSSEAIWRFELEQPAPVGLPEDELIEHCYEHGYLAECNDAMAEMYGFASAKEIVGARLGDFLVRSDPANVEYLRAFMRSGFRLTDAESHELDREGRRKFFLNNLIGIVENGVLLRAWGTQSDITERKAAEAALRESESRFRRVVESNLIGVSFSKMSGEIIYANDAYLNLLGFTRPELEAGKIRWDDLTPPEYSHLDEQAIAEIKERGLCTPFEKEHIRRDGTRVPVLVGSAQLEGDETCVAFILDLTERKRSEEIRTQLAAIVESSDDAIISKTLEGTLTSWNKGAQRMYGYGSEEVVGKPISLIIPQERSGELAKILESVRKGEPVKHLETERVRKDGTKINVSISVSPIKNSAGKVIGAATIARDIGERKRSEAERALLLEREQKARAAAERAVDRITRLQDITAALSEALTPAQVAAAVLTQGLTALGAQAGSVAWLNEGSDELELIDAVGFPPELVDAYRRFKMDAHVPLADAARAGEMVLLENFGDRKRLYPSLVSLHAQVGNEALAAVPLIVEGRTVGAMGLSFREAQQFNDEDRAFMIAIARQCAQAIVRARLYEAERRSRAEAESANRTKDEFLATLSHELRTPLTAMLGWTRLLRTSNLDEATAEHALATVERNARAQAQLIEDLLDVSRIVTGKLRLETHPVELVSIIETAVEAIRPAAEAKSIRLDTELDPLVGYVSGDPARLQQVIWNLVANAVKFTGKGGRITIGLERADSHVELSVKDTGEGIKAEFLPFVFDRFRQADGSTTRVHGGLGLGLAIVRHLVELHGGTVKAESEGHGHGASFTVILPLLSVMASATEAERSANAAGNGARPALEQPLSNLRVLVVDDERDARELLTVVLERQGAFVQAVASAAEALAVIGILKPDVLVSDIGMPNDDGYTLIRRVRSLAPEEGGRVPAIALTAYAGDDARELTLAAGFQVHLAKPIDPTELLASITRLVKQES
jgi:PAS domain S-box-containing protein